MDPTQFIRSTMPFCETLGMTASELSAERVEIHLEWRPELCTANGLLHGGAVMALADAAGGTCAYLNLPEGAAGTVKLASRTASERS